MVSELKRKLVCAHMWACAKLVVNVCPLDLVMGCYSCIGGVDRSRYYCRTFLESKNKNSCYFTVFVQYLLKPLKLEEIVGK